MLHIVHMLERRHPARAGAIRFSLVFASASALLAGIGMLIA